MGGFLAGVLATLVVVAGFWDCSDAAPWTIESDHPTNR